MKTMQKLYLLSAVILGGIFLWIVWWSRTLDSLSLSGNTLHIEDFHVKNEIPMNPNAAERKINKRLNSSFKPGEHKLIDLPKDFTSISLKGWEVFTEEGEEHIVNNEADYLQGESSNPGLTFKNRGFFLNNMHFRIFSGSIHYFRVVPEYWMDRLKKLKACGLNTVETYVAWNLHEPSPGKFDFEGILNLSWLLADPTMKVRTNHRGYIDRVNKYFSALMSQILDLQFAEGGPIIMFQVENEYLSYAEDSNHVKLLLYRCRRQSKCIICSENHRAEWLSDGILKDALHTINSDSISLEHVDFVRYLNPHFPVMVMELWCGWFDNWRGQSHQTQDINSAGHLFVDKTQLVEKKPTKVIEATQYS
ncbi:beta-galactosidase [Elysia marginata]|uniref:Beta-galactosidase n=1 Tax=Elysia marginata TaxID=1093978 RepID=A0AAV4IM09_9GAST|nr:beta-galactosidase [Elysia marginata]